MSSLAVEVNPCLKDTKASTAPLSLKLTETLESITPKGCIQKIENMDLFDSDETCSCFKPYYEDVKEINIASDEEKFEETGNALITKFQKLSTDFAQLATLMPSLANDSEIFESCGVERPFEFSGNQCNSNDPKVKQRMKKMFGFYLKDNETIGVRGSKQFSVDNLVDKLGKEIRLYTSSSAKPDMHNENHCVHPSMNFFVQKKEIDIYLNEKNRELLYNSVVLDSDNTFNSADDVSFFNLLKMNNDGTVDREGLSLLKSEWSTIGPEKNSGDITNSNKLKSYLKKKLINRCNDINKDVKEAVCSDKINKLDLNITKNNKFDHILNIVDSGKLEGDDLITGLGSIKKICKSETNGKSINGVWESLTGLNELPSEIYSQNAKNAVKFTNELSENLSLCSEICDNDGKKDDVGFCQKKDIDKLLVKYECKKLNSIDVSIEKQKCDALSLLKEEGTIKEIEVALKQYDLKEKDPETYASIADNIRMRNSKTDGKDLLSRFLDRKGRKSKEGNSEKKVESQVSVADRREDSKKEIHDDVKQSDSSINEEQRSQTPINKVAKQTANTQKDINVDSAIKRFESTNAKLSFGRSKNRNSSANSKKSKMINSSMSSANDKLNSLMSTLDEIRKDNENISSIINNKDQKAYSAKTLNPESQSRNRSQRRANSPSNDTSLSGNSGLNTSPFGNVASSNSSRSNGTGSSQIQEHVGDIARTDLIGKSSTGVSSPEDGDIKSQTAPGVRAPASVGKKASSSAISKLFQGNLESSSISDNTSNRKLVKVEVKDGVKEVNLAELLKNRDEINPGEAFILYELVNKRKVEVTLIPTFSNYKGKRFFAGYRPLDINKSNKILVDKLKAEKNLLTQN